jgi:hypothetical protein
MNKLLLVLKSAIIGGKAMNWFKVEVVESREGRSYQWVGASEDSPQEIVRKATSGEYIRLDNLRYWDRGTVRKWEEWDPTVIPSVYINPASIVSIMQFKGDPSVTPR